MFKIFTSSIISFISKKLSKITTSFRGKSEITQVNTNRNSIKNAIKRLLQSTDTYLAAVDSEKKYNDFVSKMEILYSAYDDWDIAKQNYARSSSYERKYINLLSRARRSRNQSSIRKYSTLLSRIKTSKSRRKVILDGKYSTMISRAKSAGGSAIVLWNEYQNNL